MSGKQILIVLRIGMLLVLLCAVALGVGVDDHRTRILISMGGGILLGFMADQLFKRAAGIDPAALNQLNDNIQEAQRILRENSLSSRLRGRSDNAQTLRPSDFTLTGILGNPLVILLSAGIAVLVWFSPPFVDAALTRSTAPTPEVIGAHVLALLFVAGAALGSALKIRSKADRVEP